MKHEIELSTCCNRSVTIIDGIYVCNKCEQPCETYLTMEEFFDEPKADDERISDEEIEASINELP